jgi:hypothetical protein
MPALDFIEDGSQAIGELRLDFPDIVGMAGRVDHPPQNLYDA